MDDFAAEVLEHLDGLYAFAFRLTGRRAEAEDLVQDTFVRACRYADRFEPGTHLRAWLFRMQMNLYINRFRKAKREREALQSEFVGASRLAPMGVDSGYLPDQEKRVDQDRLMRRVGQEMERLPEEHRVVLLLVDVQEMSYRETAEVLGCPVGTVMSRLHRARGALREVLGKDARALEVARPTEPGSTETASGSTAAPLVRMDRWKRGKQVVPGGGQS